MTERAKFNWQYAFLAILLALIAATPPTIVALSTHDLVNSRMSEMLEVVRASALAKGVLTEKTRAQAARGEAADERLPDRTDKDYRK